MAAASRSAPYPVNGWLANALSPIQAAVDGKSDRKKRRSMLAHRTRPSMARTAWNRWWWLFHQMARMAKLRT